MSRRMKVLLLLAGLCAAAMASRADTATVRCLANQDRVWVYDSLNSFDVQAKLKCGEVVEITSRVKGFVKIKTASGTEGWVPDSAFPELPPLPDDKDRPAGGLPLAPRSRTNAVNRPLVAAVNQPSAPASSPAPVASTVNSPASSAAAPQPSSATSAPAVVVLSTSVSTSAPAPAPVSAKATSAATPPAVAASAKPASTDGARTAASNARSGIAASSSKPASSPASSNTAASRTPAPAASNATARSNAPSSGTSTPPPKPAPAAVSNARALESTANIQPVREAASIHSVAATTESEDYPDFQPENESDNPACQVYFSAYGLAPSQFKWLAQNRKKKYPSICPAPQPSKVDFVLIFTHDADVYASSLPVPVHTDKNGFSDFSPLMTVDTAIVSELAADKARRDYVWVFQFKRGAFDPGRFSPRRRPQFTKSESKSLGGSPAGPRTVEDALRYIEEQGPSR
jgi:hypothetical protein